MFNKAYYENKGKKIKPIYHEKGEDIGVVNAQGSHMVKTKRGFEFVNRVMFRSKNQSRLGSAKNYKYIHSTYGFSHRKVSQS
jgi:hypothetical protein